MNENAILRPLPLSGVLVEDDYLKNALEKEIAYLLSLSEDRFLAGFYRNAGMTTPYVRYGGWENSLIGGHCAGHYLSALAQACAAAGVEEGARRELRRKMERLVDGLAECQQNSKGKRGFVWGALPAKEGGVEAQFDFVEQGKTNIRTQAWVPWYTMHKLLAGLLDCASLAGYAPALDVARGLGDWTAARALSWDAATRRAVLRVEYGGMNDCLYDLYAMTGEAKYARAAHVFDEETLFAEILSEGKDVLNDRHANTTIPKILGALKRYLVLHGTQLEGETVDASYELNVAKTFFRMVVTRHTYVTGGNSEWEHFGRDYVLDAERTNCNCETCNAYNMLKLARLLFCITKDRVYSDYYDATFVNSILSSQNPETGMTTYFQPMAGGFFKVFSRPYDQFWCCTGSGMESFTKLGDGIAYVCGSDLYLERYLSAHIRTEGASVRVKCSFPLSEEMTIEIEAARAPFRLHLRRPDWAAGEMRIEGGKPCEEADGHLSLVVSGGDVLYIRIPAGVALHPLPDAPDTVAFTYGNAVLSADLGQEDMREAVTGVDVTIPARRKMASERIYFRDLDVLEHPERYLLREGEQFVLRGGDVSYRFGLHYRRWRERYAIYFRLRAGEREEEAERREPLDTVQPGYGQYESDELHAMEERNSVGVTADGTYRFAKAGGYFSYRMCVDRTKKNTLSIGLRHADNGRSLRITAGGVELFAGVLNDTLGEQSYRREFEIPKEALLETVKVRAGGTEQETIVVRFEGLKGRVSAKICDFIYIYAQ